MKATVIIVVLTIIVVGGIFLVEGREEGKPPLERCVQHGGISMHIHQELKITVEGTPIAIPANLGIQPLCMSPIHTHDDTGTVHVEYPTQQDFTLGQFFSIWGQALSSTQLMDRKVDDEHQLVMIVDGNPSTEYEKLVLKDKQKIELRYERKGPPVEPATTESNTNVAPQ